MKKRLLFVIPVAAFIIIAVFLALGLTRDPRILPSALIDQPVPAFELPGLDGDGLKTEDLKTGDVMLVNIFASWCVPCRVEHPIFNQLAKEGVIVHGINYKDQPADAREWLAELGNPYSRIGSDIDGKAGIEWGVYGVPETFIIDKTGTIRYKHVGPVQARDLNEKIRPILQELGS